MKRNVESINRAIYLDDYIGQRDHWIGNHPFQPQFNAAIWLNKLETIIYTLKNYSAKLR